MEFKDSLLMSVQYEFEYMSDIIFRARQKYEKIHGKGSSQEINKDSCLKLLECLILARLIEANHDKKMFKKVWKAKKKDDSKKS